MEDFVASCFRSRNWPAEQSVYFTDPETEKTREIDVMSRHLLTRPRRHEGLGMPLINLSILCECKSLSGWNVLLLKGKAQPLLEKREARIPYHWSGLEQHIRESIELISQDPAFHKCDRNLLHSYFYSRAYPDEKQLAYHMALLQPPVDLIATAFRATKGGADERESVNPIWSAIQSTLSATEAAKKQVISNTISTIVFPSYGYEPTEIAKQIAFFFDFELTRRVFFHPVVFCKSRIFSIDGDLADVGSVRILVRDLDFDFKYVDLVRFDSAEAYIDTMLAHFEKQAYTSIRKTWDRLEDLQWEPGQASRRLSIALGVSRRQSKRSPDGA
jgi:hypothetical protein